MSSNSSSKKLMDPNPLITRDEYTIDDAISKIGTGPFQWKLLFLTGLIWAADAMEMMLRVHPARMDAINQSFYLVLLVFDCNIE